MSIVRITSNSIADSSVQAVDLATTAITDKLGFTPVNPTALDTKVTGPASATDNTLPRFDGTTGKLIQGSGVVVDDNNNMGIGTTSGMFGKVDVTSNANGAFTARASTAGASQTVNVLHAFDSAANFYATAQYSALGHKWRVNGTTDALTLDSGGNLTMLSGTLGYGAGAGGTVNQATSRGTPITLNKPSGAITLVSAAGTSSWTAFVVTNSSVSVGDLVVLSVKNSTNIYIAHTINVAAGSFIIAFAAMVGTVTDQPVINFAVIKGSTT